MPPPKLAADAPVLEIFHPVRVSLGPALGAELDVAVRHRVGGFLHAGIFQEPLHGNARLDRHMSALGVTDVVLVFLHFQQQTHFLQLRRRPLARDDAVEAVKIRTIRAVDVRVRSENVDDFQIVADADFKVRLVVGRGDFQRASAELDVHMVVRDDRNLRMRKRPEHLAPDVFRKTRVLRIHRHRHVAHQRFRTGGGNFQELARCVREFVFHEV